MFYSHPPSSVAWEVVCAYTLMSEYPPRNPREALEAEFVLDYLVTIPQESRDQ